MADHEPRHKRGKMDASTSQSSEVNETQEPSAGAQFLEPQIYAEIKARMNVPTIYYKAICLVGSKGVGKTTLLYQLYETYKKEKKGSLYYDFNQRRCWVPFEQQVTKLIEDTKSGDYQWLFIDNVQLAKGHEYAEGIICTYVKQPNHYTNLRVVAASSRAGLVFLMEVPINLNSGDFRIIVVNPQKDIAIQKVENLLPRMYKDNKTAVDKWLQYTGFRLGEVVELASWMQGPKPDEEFIARLKEFESAREESFRDALAADRGSFPEHKKDIFAKCVTICIGSGVLRKYLSPMYGLVLERLPWTLLKMTSDYSIEAVSPQAKFVINEFTRNDVSLMTEVCDLVNAMGVGNLGPLRGSFFEQLVFHQLCSSSPLKITEYQGKEETVEFKVRKRDVIPQKKLGKFTPSSNCCYFTPNMEGADIIANVDGQTYFIQCSVAKEITVKKGFWETAPEGWKPVLLVPKIEPVKKSLEEGSSDLAVEYQAKRFALADARSIMDETTIDKLMAKKEDI